MAITPSPTPYRYADHAMRVWRDWYVTGEERGWPSQSSEARAYERAKSATRTDGAAKWRKAGIAPDMPKETRRQSGPVVPNIDQARLAPWVHRYLLDLEEWRAETAKVMRVHYLDESGRLDARPAMQELLGRDYYRTLDSGMMWLEGRLSAQRPQG